MRKRARTAPDRPGNMLVSVTRNDGRLIADALDAVGHDRARRLAASVRAHAGGTAVIVNHSGAVDGD